MVRQLRQWALVGVPGWERLLFRVPGPLVGVSIRRYLGVDAAAARAVLARVDAVFDDIAERYPTGAAFSLAIASPQPT